jgi:steroid 5-alpha reductase family enzyme
MEPLTTSIWITAVTVFVYMTFAFGVAMVRRDNSLADIFWGLGFILIALITLFLRSDYRVLQILVTILVLFWGLRLAIYVYVRNKGKGEDPRYRKWREEWGRWFVLRSYLQVFLLQGLFMFLISLPIVIINTYEADVILAPTVIGSLIWLTGFYFETTGDIQLYQFLQKPENRGKVMDSGLWRYTRHPNYFGEVIQWWGIFIIATQVPYGWIGIIGPAMITFLLLRVSGILMTEKMFEGNPEFEEYKQRTSVFFPWFPGGSH